MKKKMKPKGKERRPQPFKHPFYKALVMSISPQPPLEKLAFQVLTSAELGCSCASTMANVITETVMNVTKTINEVMEAKIGENLLSSFSNSCFA